jgi:hypothetical protein
MAQGGDGNGDDKGGKQKETGEPLPPAPDVLPTPTTSPPPIVADGPVQSCQSLAEVPDEEKKAPAPAPAPKSQLKWGNPKSVPTYGHTFLDHGAKVKPSQLADRARAKDHQIGQFLDDQAAADFVGKVAQARGPGVHDVPLPQDLSTRGVLPDGLEVVPDMVRVVVKPDGSVRTSFPFDSGHPSGQ